MLNPVLLRGSNQDNFSFIFTETIKPLVCVSYRPFSQLFLILPILLATEQILAHPSLAVRITKNALSKTQHSSMVIRDKLIPFIDRFC
ncbi:MAG: hypothetical protein CMJ72_09105 [Planctomycetaceae bacterium]|nr:hypothetical protein [Planctomycetaceae bacterium]